MYIFDVPKGLLDDVADMVELEGRNRIFDFVADKAFPSSARFSGSKYRWPYIQRFPVRTSFFWGLICS